MGYIFPALWTGMIALALAGLAKILMAPEPIGLERAVSGYFFYASLALISLVLAHSQISKIGLRLQKDPRHEEVLNTVRRDVLAYLGPAFKKHPDKVLEIFFHGKTPELYYNSPDHFFQNFSIPLSPEDQRGINTLMRNARRQVFGRIQSFALSRQVITVTVRPPSNHQILQAAARLSKPE